MSYKGRDQGGGKKCSAGLLDELVLKGDVSLQ